MSITKKFLEELGLTAEQVSSVFSERGKEITTDKEELDKFKADLKEKDSSIADLNEKIKTFDGTDATLKDLQSKVADYEKVETERKEKEQQAQINADFKNRFTNVLGEQKFKNIDSENGRFGAFKEALSKEEYKGKGDSDIFAEITKDMDCFVNPQQAQITMPSGGGSPQGATDLTRAREIMGLSSK
jgi:hypothetical protein